MFGLVAASAARGRRGEMNCATVAKIFANRIPRRTPNITLLLHHYYMRKQ